MSEKFKILMERYNRLRGGGINADLMLAVNLHHEIERLKCSLRHAEMQLEHAIRGLEHKDYDAAFDGWTRQ